MNDIIFELLELYDIPPYSPVGDRTAFQVLMTSVLDAIDKIQNPEEEIQFDIYKHFERE